LSAPEFEDREIALRVDFDEVDDDGCIRAPLRFMLGPRHAIEGDTLFLADRRGNSCIGTIESLAGWTARIELDFTTWSGPGDAPAARETRVALSTLAATDAPPAAVPK
jgi:hypothetical protein